MSAKFTRKKVLYLNPVTVSAGYCSLQYLLRNHKKIGHNEGVYGWNYDVYSVYGVTICTGYRGMPGKYSELAPIYEKYAKSAVHDWSDEKERQEVERLLQDFCIQCGGTVEPWERIERSR